MAALAPQFGLCNEKVRLADLVKDCASALFAVQAAQTKALMAGLEDPSVLEKLEACRIRLESARQAFLLHLHEHGC